MGENRTVIGGEGENRIVKAGDEESYDSDSGGMVIISILLVGECANRKQYKKIHLNLLLPIAFLRAIVCPFCGTVGGW